MIDLMPFSGQPCSLGVGCDEAGVCFALAHNEPDRCPNINHHGADCLDDTNGVSGMLQTAISLIQEAKGFEGVNGGPITDHLDAAENWINDVILILESKR